MDIFILVLTVCTMDFTVFSSAFLFEHALFREFKGYYPHQIITFLNSKSREDVIFEDFIFQKLSLQAPMVSINLEDILKTKDNRSLKMPVLQDPRSSTLYAIIEKEDKEEAYSKRVHDMLDLFVRLSPIPSKPRCLMFFLSKTTSTDAILKKIMLYAWSLKFLDFSIIKFDSEYRATLMTYNPFTDSYIANSLNDENIELFPDKLRNMNGYPVSIAVHNDSRFLEATKNVENKTKVNGFVYPFFDIFSKKLNFTIDHAIHKSDNYTALLDHLFNQLENNKISAVPIPMLAGTMLYGNNHTIGTEILESKLVMIVPIRSMSKVRVTQGILIHLLTFLVIMLILMLTVYTLKFTKKGWEALDIFSILLGNNVPHKPTRLVEKIVYFTIAILSIKYSSDILVQLLTNLHWENVEQPFDTVEEILDAKMPIYGMKQVLRRVKDLPKALISKVNYKASAAECVETLSKNRSAICITPYTNAKLLIGTYGHTNGVATMKIAGPTTLHDYAAFPYERASPFLERFNQITQQIIESGMKDSWEYMWKYFSTPYKCKEYNFEKFHGAFIIALSFGFLYFLAIVVFLLEILIASMRKKLNGSRPNKYC